MSINYLQKWIKCKNIDEIPDYAIVPGKIESYNNFITRIDYKGNLILGYANKRDGAVVKFII